MTDYLAFPGRPHQCGLSYIELMVAAALLAAVLVPAMETFQGEHRAATTATQMSDSHEHLVGRMEELLALPFGELDAQAQPPASRETPTAFSDVAATPSRRLVFLSHYDGDYSGVSGDPFAAAQVDDTLLWLRVELEESGQGLETLVAK